MRQTVQKLDFSVQYLVTMLRDGETRPVLNEEETSENYLDPDMFDLEKIGEPAASEPDQLKQECLERRQQIVERARQKLSEVEADGHPYLKTHQLPGYLNALRLVADYDFDTNVGKRGRYIAPTGAGKSAVAVALATDLKARTLFITAKHDLMSQFANESIPDFSPGVTMQERSGRMRNKSPVNEAAEIEISNYLFVAQADDEYAPQPGSYDLVILDEAHLTLGKKTRQKLDPHEDAAMAAVAMTATETYPLGRSIVPRYPVLLEKKRMIDGINEGFLSGIQVFAAQSGVVFDDSVSTGEYREKNLAVLIDEPERNKLILNMALHGLRHSDGGSGLIVGARGDDQRHAREIASSLQRLRHPLESRNIYAEAIGDFRRTHSMEEYEKQNSEIIQALKHGEIDYVTTTEMATQGTDFPRLRIGILATATYSELRLEQIMGRGMRPKDAPFLFYQVIDRPKHHPERLAYAWNILGITNPSQGFSVLGPTNTADQLAPTDTLPSHIHPFPKIPAREAIEIGTRTVKHAVNTEIAAGSERVTLSVLHEQTGIAPKLLRRILFDNCYKIGYSEDASGNLQEDYPAEAAILLDYLVAQEDDKTVYKTAHELGVSTDTVEYFIKQNNVWAPQLYPRNEQKRAFMERHFSPLHREKFIAFLDQPRELAPYQISLGEIGKLAGNFNFRSRDYFEHRGFFGEPINLQGSKHTYAYDRALMTAYVASYLNAEQLPSRTDFVNVKDISQMLPGARLYHVFAAASILHIPVTYYRYRGQSRGEFIRANRCSAIMEILPRVLDYYNQQHEALQQKDATHNRHRSATKIAPPQMEDILHTSAPDEKLSIQEIIELLPVPLHRKTILQIARSLDIPADTDTIPKEQAARIHKAVIQKIVYDSGDSENTNRKTNAVRTQQLRDGLVPQLRPKQQPTEMQPRYIRELQPVNIPHAQNIAHLSVHQPVNTLLAIAQFHPFFENRATMAIGENNEVIVDRLTYRKLFFLFQNHEIETIPHTWIPAPQISKDFNIDLESLIEWLGSSGHKTDHLIRVPGVTYIRHLYFCSPELARASVDAFRTYNYDAQKSAP